jgi:hypothetical protein
MQGEENSTTRRGVIARYCLTQVAIDRLLIRGAVRPVLHWRQQAHAFRHIRQDLVSMLAATVDFFQQVDDVQFLGSKMNFFDHVGILDLTRGQINRDKTQNEACSPQKNRQD